MKHALLMSAFTVSTLISTAVIAEGNSHSGVSVRQDSVPPAISVENTETMAATAPAAGANSFTKTQATERLQEQGYTKVNGLKTDKDGIWRGTAMMNGKKQNVAVDYQGNITAK